MKTIGTVISIQGGKLYCISSVYNSIESFQKITDDRDINGSTDWINYYRENRRVEKIRTNG